MFLLFLLDFQCSPQHSRVTDSYQPSHLTPYHTKLWQGPAGAEGQAWVEALSLSEYQGCGHIRLMLSVEFKEQYSVALNSNDIKSCVGVPPESCIDSALVAKQMLKDYFK